MAGDSKSSRGNKRIIRGLYYSSKWVRDLQNSPKLRKFFEQIAGEELVPHPSFSNSPQVNNFYPLNAVFISLISFAHFYTVFKLMKCISYIQVNISYAGGTKGPVDHWHW